MNCPICGKAAYIKPRQFGDVWIAACCKECAVEARRQLKGDVGAEVVAGKRTRADVVADALKSIHTAEGA